MWLNLKFLGLFFVALVLTLVIVPVCSFVAVKLNIVDVPSRRKVHKTPKPLLGGVAIFLGFLVFSIYGVNLMRSFLSAYEVFQIKGIILSTFIIFLVGLVDDVKGLKPFAKLFFQFLCANVVYFFGIKITLFMNYPIISYILTVLWIVGITNSFNLLDNMDGLSAGVAAICGFLLYVVALDQRDYYAAYISIVMCGVALGFLKYNFYPSKIFMGDAGSLTIGFLLSVVSIYTSYVKVSVLRHLPVIIPLIIFAVPIFDTLSVIYIRLKKGVSIFKADKRHFSHRLCVLGMTQKQAVLTIYLLTFATGLPATLITKVSINEAILILLHTLMIFAIIILFERASINKLTRAGKSEEI